MPKTNKSVKTPKYVKVYDTLFSQIASGELHEGSQLPTEPELARQLGVSRSTLRQALALLQDDHLVQNVRGKGNYISRGRAYQNMGLETLSHPLHLCCRLPITDTELDIRIDVPSDYYIQNLGRKTQAVVACNHWYKNRGKVVAYSYTFLPIEVTAEAEIDLSNNSQMENFLEHGLYEAASYSSISVSKTDTGRFMILKYRMETEGAYTMLYEVVYGKDNTILAVSKHYVAEENCEILIYTRPASGKHEHT